MGLVAFLSLVLTFAVSPLIVSTIWWEYHVGRTVVSYGGFRRETTSHGVTLDGCRIVVGRSRGATIYHELSDARRDARRWPSGSRWYAGIDRNGGGMLPWATYRIGALGIAYERNDDFGARSGTRQQPDSINGFRRLVIPGWFAISFCAFPFLTSQVSRWRAAFLQATRAASGLPVRSAC